VLPSAETAAMLFWALLASGQITMRKVDVWQSLTQNSPISRLTLLPDHVSSSNRRPRQSNSNTNRDGTIGPVEGVKAIRRIAEFYVDAAMALVIKHDDGRRPVDGDFRNVPTVGEIIAQAQFASGRKGESGFAIRCPDDASPTAFCIRVVVVKSLRSQ
jgi:hypothetical protein